MFSLTHYSMKYWFHIKIVKTIVLLLNKCYCSFTINLYIYEVIVMINIKCVKPSFANKCVIMFNNLKIFITSK